MGYHSLGATPGTIDPFGAGIGLPQAQCTYRAHGVHNFFAFDVFCLRKIGTYGTSPVCLPARQCLPFLTEPQHFEH